MQTRYKGQVNGIHTCLVCGMPQTQWGATKAQVEACKTVLELCSELTTIPQGGAIIAAINEAAAQIKTRFPLCECGVGTRCACAILGTMCRRCTQRMDWCKCDCNLNPNAKTFCGQVPCVCPKFGPDGARGDCIYCRTNVQPWMFVTGQQAALNPSGLVKATVQF